MQKHTRTEVAIVGGGPGGSACAVHLAKLGVPVVVIEKEAFPRFHIGESLTEQSGSCLRELGFEESRLCQRFPIKRGVSIYGPAGRNPFWIPVMRRNAEGILENTFTWQVRRSEFDLMLLDHASKAGATVVRGQARTPLFAEEGSIRALVIRTDSEEFELECRALVDASGQRTFLANAGVTGPKRDGNYCRQLAVFSHFTGAIRPGGEHWGNTLIYFQRKYHWAWFIPLDANVTSIGFVIPTAYFRSCNETIEAFLLRELKEFNRELASRVKSVELADEVRAISNYSHEAKNFSGKGWLCIGDAHRFIDPLFSFGVSIALSEAKAAARAVHRYLNGECEDLERPFRDFEQYSERATGACQTVLDGFWESTLSFGMLLTRFRDDIIDLLAGHVWDGRRYGALAALEQTLAEARARAAAQPVS